MRGPAPKPAVAALLAACALVTSGLAHAEPVTTQPAEARPNVLLILVDDLKPAIRGYGDPWLWRSGSSYAEH